MASQTRFLFFFVVVVVERFVLEECRRGAMALIPRALLSGRTDEEEEKYRRSRRRERRRERTPGSDDSVVKLPVILAFLGLNWVYFGAQTRSKIPNKPKKKKTVEFSILMSLIGRRGLPY